MFLQCTDASELKVTMHGMCLLLAVSSILLRHAHVTLQAVGLSQASQPPAGPSIEEAAKLLQTVAHPLLLSLTSCGSHDSHDAHGRQAETGPVSQQSTDNLLGVNGSSSSTDGSDYLVESSSKGSDGVSDAQQNVENVTCTIGSKLSLTEGSQLQIQVCHPAICPWAVCHCCFDIVHHWLLL